MEQLPTAKERALQRKRFRADADLPVDEWPLWYRQAFVDVPIEAIDGVAATDEEEATEREAANDGKAANDGEAATDGEVATDGEAATVGGGHQGAMTDGRAADRRGCGRPNGEAE
eukprot:TRINITY_DN12527_c0_g1_i1.p3 TRINITY_DN12527_c0_g1~~TRINITY_DN12527_c0_g1_i1.p3  ORF type:complete len:115 (-),score=23.84 TRINITY_DN12527_c0_g1_i1:94-438(-)